MIEIKGKYNSAICYTDALDARAEEQIRALCDNEAFSESKIRIMPDVHAGNGCTIGTTMTLCGRAAPSAVGVDIGCGMETVMIEEREIDFSALDSLIRENIPAGREVHKNPHPRAKEAALSELICKNKISLHRAECSIGTLGGGNHFIEVDRDSEGRLYIVVHSGSRHLGREVAEYYIDEAHRYAAGAARHQIEAIIKKLRAEGREGEIQSTISSLKDKLKLRQTNDLDYLEGELFDAYIHDMRIVQRFAEINREAMVEKIVAGLGLHVAERFTTVHNYIDTDTMILRKGAVSCKAGEKLLIPINMRDGALICIGRGNAEWNCSAPHGAGRLMSRGDARRRISMDDYLAQMSGIWSTSVTKSTLDESPMAYKPIEDIVRHIGPTADILCRIKPTYNFKASD